MMTTKHLNNHHNHPGVDYHLSLSPYDMIRDKSRYDMIWNEISESQTKFYTVDISYEHFSMHNSNEFNCTAKKQSEKWLEKK